MKHIVIVLLTVPWTLADQVERTVILGNNHFAADIYKQLSREGVSNFLFSPFSAETLLAFAQSGARGFTARELQNSLHLPSNQNVIENGFQNLLRNLKQRQENSLPDGTIKEPYSFHTANKVYLPKGYYVKDNFERIATAVFDADVENINFGYNDEAARRMNQWVEQKTNNKIHDLISSDTISAYTRAVLINALYLRANWENSFNERRTKNASFYTDRGLKQVDMMHLYDEDSTYNYAENRELKAQFLELPFQGGDLSMVFVLPFATDGIALLERRIDEVLVQRNFNHEYVNITIPKFRTESRIDVKNVLENLGVRKAFSPIEADFSGLTDDKVFISDVIQKTFIDVNEKGVEAAAATYAGVTLLSIHSSPEPKQFYADHPFIYYIKFGNLILFVGRVGAPKY